MELTFGPAKPGDLEQVAELSALCLQGAPREYFAARMLHDPGFTFEGNSVARDGNRVVSNVHVYSYEMAFGESRVKVAAIGDVATHPDYRGRGAAKKLMAAAHDAMRSRGQVLSTLFTSIQPYYEPMGYRIWERREVHLLDVEPPSVPVKGIRVRPLDPEQDVRSLTRMRANYSAPFLGWEARTEERWLKSAEWTPFYPREDRNLSLVIEDSRGERLAYIRAKVDRDLARARVLEFACQPNTAAATEGLGAVFAAVCRERGATTIEVPAPARILVGALSRYTGKVVPVANQLFMMKVIDLRGFLKAMEPELTRRAVTAHVKQGAVALRVNGQLAVVGVHDFKAEAEPVLPDTSNLPRAELDLGRWIEVFMGAKVFSRQPFASSSRLGEAEINLLDALFPLRESVYWEADSF